MWKKYIYVISTYENWSGNTETQGYFSSRRLAEKAMKLRPNWDWQDIYKIELDNTEELEPTEEELAPKKPIYHARTKLIWEPDVRTWEDAVRTEFSLPNDCDYEVNTSRGGHWDTVYARSLISKEHAIETLQKGRREFIDANRDKLSYDPDWNLKDRFPEGVA